MILRGKLLDLEHREGKFNDRVDGHEISFDFVVLHVLEGREVHKIRLPKEVNALDLPFGRDDEIEIDVTVPKDCKLVYNGLPSSALV